MDVDVCVYALYVFVCIMQHLWGEGVSYRAEKEKIILGESRDWVSYLVAAPCHRVWIEVLESRDHVFDHPVLTEEWMDRCMGEWVVLAMKQIAVSSLQLTELPHWARGGPCSVCLSPHGQSSYPPVLLLLSPEVEQCCSLLLVMWGEKGRKGWVLCFHTADVGGMGDWSIPVRQRHRN